MGTGGRKAIAAAARSALAALRVRAPENGTAKHECEQMKRHWTDRHGTTWEVEIYDGESVDDSLSRERWIEFRPSEGKPEIVAPNALEKPEEELSSAELQELVDDAKREAGIE